MSLASPNHIQHATLDHGLISNNGSVPTFTVQNFDKAIAYFIGSYTTARTDAKPLAEVSLQRAKARDRFLPKTADAVTASAELVIQKP